MPSRKQPKLPLKKTYRGTVYEFVDKTETEARQELRRLDAALLHAKRLLKPCRRLPHPSWEALWTHLCCIRIRHDIKTPKELAQELCRVNVAFLDGVSLLEALKSDIEPLSSIRFHLTYSCTHRKRDLSSGWNKGTISDEVDVEQEA